MKKNVLSLVVLLAALTAVPGCFRSGPKTSDPEESGMNKSVLRRLDHVLNAAVVRKDFPGAVVLVGRKDKVVYRQAFGDSQWVPSRREMTTDMIFDLASLTKPIATATSIMILVERGELSLDEKVKDYIPDFAAYKDEQGNAGEDARVWHLLTHTSGLPPYTDAALAAQALGSPVTTAALATYIAHLPKTDPPGKSFHYSCLGYITLAHIVKHITGRSIADFAAENIFKPLGMKDTFFTPPDKVLDRCVPTQVVDGRPLQGKVHDPLAALQGGVSGNAGLFSTADDLAVFAQMILNKGTYRETRILGPLAVERMTEAYAPAKDAGRGLGWDLDSPYATNRGDLFGPASFGHTGYTGTSIWIDPETGTYVIFLTNRVHPDDKGSIIALRSRVANVVAASIMSKTVTKK
jgi:CubicO group peptidase (beta-lactamase class C family)